MLKDVVVQITRSCVNFAHTLFGLHLSAMRGEFGFVVVAHIVPAVEWCNIGFHR